MTFTVGQPVRVGPRTGTVRDVDGDMVDIRMDDNVLSANSWFTASDVHPVDPVGVTGRRDVWAGDPSVVDIAEARRLAGKWVGFQRRVTTITNVSNDEAAYYERLIRDDIDRRMAAARERITDPPEESIH